MCPKISQPYPSSSVTALLNGTLHWTQQYSFAGEKAAEQTSDIVLPLGKCLWLVCCVLKSGIMSTSCILIKVKYILNWPKKKKKALEQQRYHGTYTHYETFDSAVFHTNEKIAYELNSMTLLYHKFN